MKNNFPRDEDLRKSLQELDKSIQGFTNQRNQELRQMFGKFIKPNLMIRIKSEIKRSPEFINVLNLYQFDGRSVHALGMDDVDFDICVNLAMINWYLLLPIKDDAKHTYYSNSSYIQNIKERTIKQCRLRPLIQNYEERNFILAHTPLHYSMHCMVNFLLSRIDDNLKKLTAQQYLMQILKSIRLLLCLKTLGQYYYLQKLIIAEAHSLY